METGTKIVLSVPFFCIVAAVWALLWALIGYLLGDRARPRRYILVEESGAWTAALLHSVDNRKYEEPIDLSASND